MGSKVSVPRTASNTTSSASSPTTAATLSSPTTAADAPSAVTSLSAVAHLSTIQDPADSTSASTAAVSTSATTTSDPPLTTTVQDPALSTSATTAADSTSANTTADPPLTTEFIVVFFFFISFLVEGCIDAVLRFLVFIVEDRLDPNATALRMKNLRNLGNIRRNQSDPNAANVLQNQKEEPNHPPPSIPSCLFWGSVVIMMVIMNAVGLYYGITTMRDAVLEIKMLVPIIKMGNDSWTEAGCPKVCAAPNHPPPSIPSCLFWGLVVIMNAVGLYYVITTIQDAVLEVKKHVSIIKKGIDSWIEAGWPSPITIRLFGGR